MIEKTFIYTIYKLMKIENNCDVDFKQIMSQYFFHFLLQLVLGLGIFLLPFASSQLRASYLSSHVFFGIAILSMAAGTCLLGILEKIFFSK